MKYLVSACLVGQKCKYNGKENKVKEIKKLLRKGEAIPVCPELMGGLQTPREPAEMISCEGNKYYKIKTASGKDVTEEFIIGAGKALKLAKENGIKMAILKSRSPSCGCGLVYDGTFSHKLIEGDGVTAKILKINGIKVITEEEFLQNKILGIKQEEDDVSEEK